MNLQRIKGVIWRLFGRCYYCGHTKGVHLAKNIRECKAFGCDCFGFDVGPVVL